MKTNKKILIGILITIIVLLAVLAILVYKPLVIKESVEQRFSDFKSQYQEKQAQGYDVTEAEALARQAKRAYDKRKYAKADRLLDEAFEALKKAEIPEVPKPTPPSILPPEYEEWYNDINEWLDEKLVEWRPTEYKTMKFTGFHISKSYGLTQYTDSSDDLKFLDMLDELDVEVIGLGISISEKHPPRSLERWDILINEIRNKNKELKVWHFGGTFDSKEEHKDDYIEHGCYGVEYIIQRWQPEYLSIVHEISNQQEPRATRDDWDFWKEYIETVANHAKNVAEDTGYNITTTVALQAYPSEIDFVDYLVDIPNLDVIGFDVYNRWGLCEECQGGDVLKDKIDLIHSHGKEVWIEETWLTTQNKPGTPKKTERFPGFDDPKRAEWDSRWMTVITYYAQNHDVVAVEPFFTNYFIFYPNYSPYEYMQKYADDYRTALAEERRTQTFCAFKDVIEEVKRNS